MLSKAQGGVLCPPWVGGRSIWTRRFLSPYCSAARASLRGDVTAFQTADKWLSVAADEQRRERCLRWWDGEHKHRRVDGGRAACVAHATAQLKTYACRASPLLRFGEACFLGGWGAVSSDVLWFFPRRATQFKMLEICLLTHTLWLQRLLIAAEGYLIQALLLPCSFYLQWRLKKLICLSTLWRSERQYWCLTSHTIFFAPC